MRNQFTALLVSAVFAQAPAGTSDRWYVVSLHPSEASASSAVDSTGSNQVGAALLGGVRTAVLWRGASDCWLNLAPAGATDSVASSAAGNLQAGWAVIAGVRHAGIWEGTAESWRSLQPVGALQSSVSGTDGTNQAGYAVFPGVQKAGIWGGTAESWVSLHPAGTGHSEASWTEGGQQAGWAMVGGVQRASVWNGTPDSWVDLHPAGATESWARGTNGAQQAGYATLGGNWQASLWSGTAESWINLNPSGALISRIEAFSQSHQVGLAGTYSNFHAGIWSGTSASYQDLHSFLPAGLYAWSLAHGVQEQNGFIQVLGHAYRYTLGDLEAILWISPPAGGALPEAMSVVRGVVAEGGMQRLYLSDDCRLAVKPFITLSSSEAPVQVALRGTSTLEAPTSLRFSLEAHASESRISQRIELLNYWTGAYETVSVQNATLTDATTEIVIGKNAARFVQAGTRAMSARISYRENGTVSSYPWEARIDQAMWTTL